MEKNLMDFEEAKKYLNVSKSTLYRLLQTHKFPASKIGGQWRFRKERLDKWLEEQEDKNMEALR